MKIAKASKEDLAAVQDFLLACELSLDRGKFSLFASEDQWLELDDDDDDKKRILKIRKGIAEDEGCEPEEVDNRILMFEWLKSKFYHASCSWRRVHIAADVLIDNCTDPTEDVLAWYPGVVVEHVEREQ